MFVHFAHNDDNGNASGELYGVQITDLLDLDLDGDALAFELHADHLIIEGKRFACTGVRTWVGNICWDGAHITPIDVARLLEVLRANNWTPNEGDMTLFQAYEHNEDMTALLIEAEQ